MKTFIIKYYLNENAYRGGVPPRRKLAGASQPALQIHPVAKHLCHQYAGTGKQRAQGAHASQHP